jgi:hypothetical protein
MKLLDFPPISQPLDRWLKEFVRVVRENNVRLVSVFKSYITDREEPVGYAWVDGTTVFQKTIAITEAFCETHDTDIAHGITNFNELVALEVRFKGNSFWHVLPFVAASGASVSAVVDATNITSVISGTPAFTSWSGGYATIWYTTT